MWRDYKGQDDRNQLVFVLVLAHLEAAQIRACAAALTQHVRPGGRLLIAGFLTAEQEIVSSAFPQPLQFTDEQGWAAAIIEPLGSQPTT